MPVVASYCTTFLKPEMLHIYRQVTGLRTFGTFVMTKERQCPDRFPFDAIEVLPRPRIHFLARFHKKYLRRMEPVFYRGEYDQLAAVLARRHADLLHVYFGHTGVHLLPFIRNWSGPALVSFHGMDIMSRAREPGYDARMRELLGLLPMVLARSESLARRLAALGCDPAKIRINRTGIPLDDFPFRERTAPADGAWRLVQASRLIEKKGLDDALHAFAGFRSVHPLAQLTIAGDGPQRGELEALALQLGIADAVAFPGFQSQQELRALFERSHFFLHPSRMTGAQDQEGVPNSMLEAMAAGLPVVATRHGGIPEAVTHGVEGLLTAERDWDGLRDSLLTLSADPARCMEMGRAASESVRAKFEQGASIAALEGFYSELIESHRRNASR
ncbi:MAG: glycosyltransferase [Terrimicrobiaceae bacterium]|nr:glycosyltransferase [Terrimicrobiaceae bacterium]